LPADETRPRGAPSSDGSGTGRESSATHTMTAPDAPPSSPQAAEGAKEGDEKQPSEADRLREQLLRLTADFANYRKRMHRHGSQIAEESKEALLSRLLPVLDHFELGLNSAHINRMDGQIVAGFQFVYDQLSAVLTEEGLSRIEARERSAFDPHTHECVSHVTSEEHPENMIVAETRRGYRLGRKVLRAAQVVVSSGPRAPAGGDGSGAKTKPESADNSPDKGPTGEAANTGPPQGGTDQPHGADRNCGSTQGQTKEEQEV